MIGASVFQRFERGGRSGKALFWEIEKRRIEDAVDSFLLRDAETIRTEHRVPLFAELGFGDGDSPAVSVQVAGSELFLKGKIDRIDRVRALSRGDGDGVVVVDYKTGKHDQYSGLKRDPTDRGRHLQPTLYALAAEQLLGDAGGPATQVVRSELQFVGSRSAAPLTVVLDDGARRELGEVLGIITRLKVHGIFPARPGGEGGHSPDNCEHCDFDSVCPVDRGRAWDRIKADPLVERYAALAEPADEEPADPGADFAGRDGDLPPVQSAADAAHSGSGPADE